MRVTDFSACNKKQKNLPQRILCQNWRSEKSQKLKGVPRTSEKDSCKLDFASKVRFLDFEIVEQKKDHSFH